MDKPWFNLDPNNLNDRWWSYSDIVNKDTANIQKTEDDILCQLIIQDTNVVGIEFWRCITWYKDDPNRYLTYIYESNWNFDKSLVKMKQGEIIIRNNIKFKVYISKFGYPEQVDYLKILERIEE
jgi:hypothetical protein